MKITIEDSKVESQQINGRNGVFTSQKQWGWISMPNGERRRVRINVQNGVGYPTGEYTVSEESFMVGEYGDLKLGALKLVPVAVRPAQVAGAPR